LSQTLQGHSPDKLFPYTCKSREHSKGTPPEGRKEKNQRKKKKKKKNSQYYGIKITGALGKENVLLHGKKFGPGYTIQLFVRPETSGDHQQLSGSYTV